VLPLKMAGPAWTASSATQRLASSFKDASVFHFSTRIAALDFSRTYTAYVPVALHHYPPIPPGCPCGVFNEQNQMIYLIP
jgi:hypothetical protein